MGSIQIIMKGEGEEREIEGRAEIVNVVEYLGGGLYLVDCIFCEDADRKVVSRLFNIDERVPKEEKEGGEHAS